MIAKLRGVLSEKSPGEVVVDVAGVGYHAHVSLSTFCRLPEEGAAVELFIVTNLRENALELFGFRDRKERAAFTLLRGVSGIGPRLALTILSGIDADELSKVVREGRTDRLVAVPGVGKKTAERVLVELRGRMEGLEKAAAASSETEGGGLGAVERDAVSALVALGYREVDARSAVSASREPSDPRLEGWIKRALMRLAS
jgi:Holliday junction DNA helicase RuvA